MTVQNKNLYIYMSDLIENPNVRECRIIKFVKGKLRPNDKYILAEIVPPLLPFPECNIKENVSNVVLALVDNTQDLDDVGREIVMAEIVYPRYDKKGNVDEDISVKLGIVTLHLDFENAKNNTLYKKPK